MNSFNVMSLKTDRNFEGATVPEKTGSRERKQKQDPLGSRRWPARCVRWHSARGIAEWFYRRWPWAPGGGEGTQGRRLLPGLWAGEGGRVCWPGNPG